MKKLGVFVCILVTSLSLFGSFLTPKKVFAQTNPPVVATYSMLQETAYKIFSKVQSGLNPGASVIDKNLFQLIGGAKVAYENNVTKLRKGGANISAKDVYVQSLGLSLAYINTNGGGVNFQDQKSIAVIDALKSQLINEIQTQGLVQNYSTPTASSSAAANATQAAAAASAPDIKKECTLWNWTILGCADAAANWLIKTFLLEIAGFLLWATANMFNYSVVVGILNFSQWAPDTLYPVWTIVRQMISLIIVFVGLYLGFMYILGKEDKFERYIPWVVVFALFVNFSYPLTRTAIDVSNIVSLKIYASAIGNGGLTNNTSSSQTAGALIVSRLGLQGLLASSKNTTTGDTLSMVKSLNSTPASLMAVAFVLYAAYIFFIVTSIIVIRTASLVFIIIVSPLLLVDSVLPMLGDRAKALRKIFFEQLLVGPVFMLMLALTLKFLEVFSLGALKQTSTEGTITTFFNVLLMLIMLHIMIKVTKSVAGDLGTYATEAMGKVGGFGLGVASGGAGMLARKGIGGMAMKARDSGWVKNNQDTFVGRRAYDLTNSVAKSSFDLRNSKVIAKGAGMAGMGTGLFGVGMGAGQKTNFEEESKRRIEKINTRKERIKTRYERDVYAKDEKGNIIFENGVPKVQHKKGELDEEAAGVKERFIANKGGAVFLTKKQKEEMEASYVEEKTKNNLELYKKLPKNKRGDKFNELKAQLAEIQKTDRNLESQEAQAIVRTLDVINKENTDYSLQIDKALDTFKNLPTQEKKDSYLANLDKDLRTEVQKRLNLPVAEQSQEKTATPNQPQLGTTSPSSATRFDTTDLDKAGLVPKDINTKDLDRAGLVPKEGRGGVDTVDIDITQPELRAQGTTNRQGGTPNQQQTGTAPSSNNPRFDTTDLDRAGLVPRSIDTVDIDITQPEPRTTSTASRQGIVFAQTKTSTSPSSNVGTTTPPAKSLIVDQNGNHFDLDARGNPIDNELTIFRTSAKRARESRQKENTSTGSNVPQASKKTSEELSKEISTA